MPIVQSPIGIKIISVEANTRHEAQATSIALALVMLKETGRQIPLR